MAIISIIKYTHTNTVAHKALLTKVLKTKTNVSYTKACKSKMVYSHTHTSMQIILLSGFYFIFSSSYYSK